MSEEKEVPQEKAPMDVREIFIRKKLSVDIANKLKFYVDMVELLIQAGHIEADGTSIKLVDAHIDSVREDKSADIFFTVRKSNYIALKTILGFFNMI